MNKLRELRIDRDLTIKELADLAGVSETTISNIENEHSKAQGRTLGRLAKVFGIKVNELDELLNKDAAQRGAKGGAASRGKPKTRRGQELTQEAEATQPGELIAALVGA